MERGIAGPRLGSTRKESARKQPTVLHRAALENRAARFALGTTGHSGQRAIRKARHRRQQAPPPAPRPPPLRRIARRRSRPLHRNRRAGPSRRGANRAGLDELLPLGGERARALTLVPGCLSSYHNLVVARWA